MYRTAREGASSAAASFSSRVGMPSCPGLFLVLSCLSGDSTSAGEVVMVGKVEVISGVVRIGGVVGGGGGAVCDRLFTLLGEEAIEHICLVLRCSCLMWKVMEIRDWRCGFLL